jgi:hypothetical protein
MVSFSCDVVVDADLSANDEGYTHYSDLFPESSRTYTIKGYLIADDCSAAEILNLPAVVTKTMTVSKWVKQEKQPDPGSKP